MNQARRNHAAVALGGKIYVFGGMPPASRLPTRAAECYDPETDRWEELEPLPMPLHLHAAAALGGNIYLFGGDTAREQVSGLVVRYRPRADAYQVVGRMPVPLMALSAHALGNRIMVLGGVNAQFEYNRRCWLVQPDSGEWTDAPPLIQPRMSFGSAVRNREVWVADGVFHGPVAVVERFTGRDWQAVTRLPVSCTGSGAAFVGDVLVVAGGVGDMRRMPAPVQGYNVNTGRWFEVVQMNQPRAEHAVVELDGVVYVLGGVGLGEMGRTQTLASAERLSEVLAVENLTPHPVALDTLCPYPNPSNTSVAIPLPAGQWKVEIVDLRGRLVTSGEGRGGSAWMWDAAGNTGLFFYRLSDLTSGRRFTGRVVVTR